MKVQSREHQIPGHDTAAPRPEPAPQEWKRTMRLLWVCLFLTSAGITMVVPFLAIYVQELGVTDVKEAAVWASVIFAVNHVVIALMSPFWGRISDRYGQKRLIVLSGIAMGLVMATMGFAMIPLHLLALRILFGLANAVFPAAQTMLSVQTPKEHIGQAVGTVQTGNMLGQLLGPLIGGALSEAFGMRSSFFITGACLAAAALLVLIFSREQRAAGFGASERKSAAPVTFKMLITETPVLLHLMLCGFLMSASLQSISPILPLYLKMLNVTEQLSLISGLMFAALGLGMMIASPVLGRLGDRIGHGRILIASVIVMGILHVPQALIQDPWSLLAARFLTGLTIGGLITSVTALLRHLTPLELQGTAHGYNSSFNSVGNVSGALLGGLLVSQVGIASVFYLLTALFLIYTIVLLRYRRALQ